MSKSMTNITIDEKHLLELIKMKPELYDLSNEYAKDNNRKKIAWEEISTELDASVDHIKRIWRKLRMNFYKHPENNDMKKVLQLHSVDNNSNLSKNIRLHSNDTITSDNCELSKRILRSGLKLPAITETKLSSSSSSSSSSLSSSSFYSNKTQSIVFHDNSHHKSTINETNVQTNQKGIHDDNGKITNDTDKKSNNKQSRIIVDKSDRNLRPRQMKLLTIESKENTIPLRTTKTSLKSIKSKQKKLINYHDATRTFFDSMAMTVNTFPSHYRATIKMKICNIIAETEYKLSLEKTN